MINIKIGYECGDGFYCDKYKQCKYKVNSYKLHDLSLNIHRFFKDRLHIKLPHLIYITHKYERLSGTSKCPYHKSRYYNCYDCKHICGESFEECNNKLRNDTPYEERLPHIETEEWGKRCAYFEKSEWADDYRIK